MPPLNRMLKRLGALVAALAMTGSLFTVTTIATASPAAALPCGKVTGCTAFELIHAGASYNWYPVSERYEFKGGREAPKQWKLTGKGRQYQQNGMLTLVANKGKHTKSVASSWNAQSAKQGRWEARVRTRTYGKGADFKVQLALVPAKRTHRACSRTDLTFMDFHPSKSKTHTVAAHAPGIKEGRNRAYTFTKKLPRAIGNEEWHVFGVEVTKKRIAWFVDGKVVATEKRDGALTGENFTMQARLVPTAGKTMAKTRFQLDWARHWTMKKKGKALGNTAKAKVSTYAAAC